MMYNNRKLPPLPYSKRNAVYELRQMVEQGYINLTEYRNQHLLLDADQSDRRKYTRKGD
jgi:hypothetical protein